MALIFWCSLFVLTYIYFLYPIGIYLCGLLSKQDSQDSSHSKETTIFIVVPAYNEEKVIEGKINNHLELKHDGLHFKIIVVSDGSTDNTNAIALKYVDKYPSKIEFLKVDDRLGKTSAINTVMEHISDRADIVLFSDANVLLDENALIHMNNAFKDPKVGCVAGKLYYINENANGISYSNGLYWRYEESIKLSESNTGSMMGADGSIFAVRRNLYRKLPLFVLDDFCTSMGVIMQGYELKFCELVKAYEKGAEKNSEEFKRKIRIANRSFNSYLHLRPEILKTFKFSDLLKLYSHKVLRWYSIFFMFTLLVSNIILINSNPNWLYSTLLYGQGVFYLSGIVSSVFNFKGFLGKVLGICEYFIFSNLASGIGIVQSISGIKTSTWKIAKSTR